MPSTATQNEIHDNSQFLLVPTKTEIRTLVHTCLDCGDRLRCAGEFCEGCDDTDGFICNECKGVYR